MIDLPSRKAKEAIQTAWAIREPPIPQNTEAKTDTHDGMNRYDIRGSVTPFKALNVPNFLGR